VRRHPSSGADGANGSRDLALVRAEAEVSSSRDQVARSVLELQRELARVADWREWIRRKPVLAVGLAFGLGFLLGRRV
jgi:ElaB/YqjD/DUF883 family membrane-anchored ribosome-binding protein